MQDRSNREKRSLFTFPKQTFKESMFCKITNFTESQKKTIVAIRFYSIILSINVFVGKDISVISNFEKLYNYNFTTRSASCDEYQLDEAEEVEEFTMTSLGKLVFADTYSRHPPPVIAGTSSSSNDDDSLSLAFENLFHMPYDIIENYGNKIHTLDISHNNFGRSLHFLAEFENLHSLIMDHNNIDALSVFPFMPKLQLLWLNGNKIEELYPFLKNLYSSFPNLRYLSLMENKAAPSYFNGGSFYDYLQYRLFVISWFPHLEHLDDRTITPEQRIEAKRLFKRPVLEQFVDNAPLPECIKYLHSKLATFFAKPISLPDRFKFARGPNFII